MLVTRRGLDASERPEVLGRDVLSALPAHRILPEAVAAPALALWNLGLALDRIDRYGVTLTVPGFAP